MIYTIPYIRKRITGPAYLGAIGAAVLGPAFFDETLTPVKAFWLAVIIGGVVWLKLADGPKPEHAARAPR
jgi:quaternary ammonium compound-resistance protein SugE